MPPMRPHVRQVLVAGIGSIEPGCLLSYFLDKTKLWCFKQTVVICSFCVSAAAIGFGAYFADKWTHGRWPLDIVQNPPSIAFLELYPIMVAVQCWAPFLTNRKVQFHADNIAVVHIINRQSRRCPRIIHLLRLLVFQCLTFNICFRAVHVPAKVNDIADALSRFQMERFGNWLRNALQKMNFVYMCIYIWTDFWRVWILRNFNKLFLKLTDFETIIHVCTFIDLPVVFWSVVGFQNKST